MVIFKIIALSKILKSYINQKENAAVLNHREYYGIVGKITQRTVTLFTQYRKSIQVVKCYIVVASV